MVYDVIGCRDHCTSHICIVGILFLYFSAHSVRTRPGTTRNEANGEEKSPILIKAGKGQQKTDDVKAARKQVGLINQTEIKD